MQLVILCRTQGRNLSDYMFREGCNVAIHVLDNIVYEAAGLAYKELQFVSEKLRRDVLWESVSSKNTVRQPKVAEEDIHEMLRLCHVQPLLDSLGSNRKDSQSEVLTNLLGPESGIDWTACCLRMQREPVFTPNWSLKSEGFATNLYFDQQEDIFVSVGVDQSGRLLRVGLVEKDKSVTVAHRQMTIQRFANFLLHFIWHNL
jgi:hypothetical protein